MKQNIKGSNENYQNKSYLNLRQEQVISDTKKNMFKFI